MFRWFRSDYQLGTLPRVLLPLIPFVIFVAGYAFVGHLYHLNSEEGGGGKKVFPTLSEYKDGIKRAAFEKDRNGDVRLWVDTWASLKRAGIALAIATTGIILGLLMGVFPIWESTFRPFTEFFDKIPALAVSVVIFGVLSAFGVDGLGDAAKIIVIVIGVFPPVVIDAYLRTKEIPREQLFKAQSLGASEPEIAFRVVLPQIFPKMLDTLRIQLKGLILLLIAVETLGADSGLGYRIFTLRRYMAMEIIIPYILWIVLLALVADQLLQFWIRRFCWVDK